VGVEVWPAAQLSGCGRRPTASNMSPQAARLPPVSCRVQDGLLLLTTASVEHVHATLIPRVSVARRGWLGASAVTLMFGLLFLGACYFTPRAMSAEVGPAHELPGSVEGETYFAHWIGDGTLITACYVQLCEWSGFGPSAWDVPIEPLSPGDVSFSRDGAQIAYFEDTGARPGLHVVASDGGDVRTFDPDVWISNCCLVWSDDSRTLYFQESQGAIDALEIATGVVTQLTPKDTWATVVDQRNGVLLEQRFEESALWEIYEQSATGGPLTDLHLKGYGPRFSPSGAQIAYVSASDNRVHVADADGSDDVAISPAVLEVAPRIAWSPEGDLLVFASEGTGDIWTAAPDGSDLRRIATLPGEQEFATAAWSSDGSRLAFTSSNADHSTGLAFVADACSEPEPEIIAVSPKYGVEAGGTQVVIAGDNLGQVSSVMFGEVPATSFAVHSNTSLVAVAPPGGGAIDVTVATPACLSVITTADGFTYVPPGPPPTVAKLKPKTGRVSGGTSVTLTGTNFADVTAVDFGGVAAASFHVVSANSITAVTPAHVAGRVQVTVATPNGTSSVSKKTRFRFR
jgi:hypothetical protein